MTPWDKAREEIERDYMDGSINREEYHRLMREVDRDERDAARESAQDAYERELDN